MLTYAEATTPTSLERPKEAPVCSRPPEKERTNKAENVARFAHSPHFQLLSVLVFSALFFISRALRAQTYENAESDRQFKMRESGGRLAQAESGVLSFEMSWTRKKRT
jgi:hypothetical protein